MTNQIERMKRIRLVLEEAKEKILRNVFIAKCSLKFGVSSRTIDSYLNTLIDAGNVLSSHGYIWRKV